MRNSTLKLLRTYTREMQHWHQLVCPGFCKLQLEGLKSCGKYLANIFTTLRDAALCDAFAELKNTRLMNNKCNQETSKVVLVSIQNKRTVVVKP